MVGECREQEQGCGGHGRAGYVGGGGKMHTGLAATSVANGLRSWPISKTATPLREKLEMSIHALSKSMDSQWRDSMVPWSMMSGPEMMENCKDKGILFHHFDALTIFKCSPPNTTSAMKAARSLSTPTTPCTPTDDHGHLFTVVVNYGGTFIGSGINMSYKGGVIDLYDFCEIDKWNLKALERVLEDNGIVMREARVLWCLPGQSVQNFGLANITNDQDCINMADGSDFEEEIVDSDYDLYEGDDDLYVDCIEDDESDKDLELPESDDEQVKFKFNNFTLVDMANPQFKVGQTFASVELLRKAIRKYRCKERVNISIPTNDKNRIAARYILEAREFPVLTMIDRINQQMMTRENPVPARNYTFSNLNDGNPTLENVEDSMLEEMVHQVPPPNTRSVHPRPLPYCTFISAEQSQNVASGGSSSGLEHNIAAKAEAMKMAKLREHEEKKEASVAAKLNKTTEAKQLKSELAQQRRLQAQQKKEEAAELRKLAAAQKKEALLAARQEKVAQKEAEKARKAAAKQHQAAHRRAPQPSTSHPKKVSMFDELRG
ncbi:hypothetical protein ACQ4PT_046370 [Festuca glaucescens]